MLGSNLLLGGGGVLSHKGSRERRELKRLHSSSVWRSARLPALDVGPKGRIGEGHQLPPKTEPFNRRFCEGRVQ